jgi:hypothetical protein
LQEPPGLIDISALKSWARIRAVRISCRAKDLQIAPAIWAVVNEILNNGLVAIGSSMQHHIDIIGAKWDEIWRKGTITGPFLYKYIARPDAIRLRYWPYANQISRIGAATLVENATENSALLGPCRRGNAKHKQYREKNNLSLHHKYSFH